MYVLPIQVHFLRVVSQKALTFVSMFHLLLVDLIFPKKEQKPNTEINVVPCTEILIIGIINVYSINYTCKRY